MTTRLLSSLATAPHTALDTIDIGASVAFPRAHFTDDAIYAAQYRAETKPLMRAWLVRALRELGDLFSLSWNTYHDAGLVAEEIARRELGRPLFAPELNAIESALRDLITVTVAARARESELLREIL